MINGGFKMNKLMNNKYFKTIKNYTCNKINPNEIDNSNRNHMNKNHLKSLIISHKSFSAIN